MISLLTFKEKLKNFYSENEFVIKPILKFIFCFAALVIFKFNIGFAPVVNMWVVIVVMSIVMAFIPRKLNVVILMAVMLFDMFCISKELAAIISILIIILLVLFLRFTPEQGIFLLLVPIAFFLKIPYVIPLVAGLVCTPTSIVSTSFGTIIYFLMDTVSKNSTAIANISKTANGSKEEIGAVNSISTTIISNPNLYLTLVTFAVTIAVVYAIRRKSVDHSWKIAIIVGSIIELVLFLVGGFIFKIESSLLLVILGTVVSFVIAFILQMFLFSVDYTRTENTQFEDDEYYYYVKAVPKINVTAPEMNVKRINAQRRKKSTARKDK